MASKKPGILSRLCAPIGKLALTLCAIGVTMNILGDPVQWDAGGEDNYWSTGANWGGDVAPDGVGANFDLWDLEGEQVVEFSDDASAAGMYVWSYGDRAAYKFVGNNKTLTLSATAQLANGDIDFTNLNVTFSDSELRLAGDRNGDVASLTQDGGTVALHGWTYIGGGWNNEYSGCKGEYTLKGNGSFGGNDDFHIAWGDSCTGIVSIVNGTVACTYRTMLGEGPNSKSSLTVGENSSWNCGSFYMASGANANAEAENNGTFTVGGDFVIGQGEGSLATFTLCGGTTTAASLTCGAGTGKVVFNGGTAVATTAADGDFIPVAANYTVEIGNNGGTINNANNISISAAITGAGWLMKTGDGTLSLSDVAGFTGRIAVAENAGSVTLPASATNIKVGANTTKEVTENGIVFSYSATDYSNADNYWTGAGEGNDWATAGNWNIGLVGANNFVFHSGTLQGNAVSVEFADAYTGGASLFIENTTGGVVTFAKADGAGDTAGLSLSGALNVGTSTGDAGALTITSGDFTVGGATTIGNGNAGKLTISGGRLYSSGDYQLGFNANGDGTFELSGGEADSTFWFCTGRWGDSGGGSATITITDGTLKIGQGENSNGMIDLSCTEGSSTTFTQSGGYVYAPGNKNSKDPTVGCALSICGANNATAGVTLSGTANMELGGYVSVGTWGTGTLTVSGGTLTTTAIKAGGGTGTVTLSGGTVVAGADGTFIPASDKLTVTVTGNATLDTNGKTITIDAAMLGDGTLTCVGGGTVTFTSLDSTCNIVADGATVNKPEAYYWIGGAVGDWNDGNNWSRSNGGAAAGVYPSALTDMVAIDTPATITLTDNVSVHEVIASAEVVLTGGKSLGFVTMRGDGLVTMSNVTFTVSVEDSTPPFVINSNICVAKGTQNTFACSTLKNYLYGNLYGSGFLGVYSGSNNTAGGLLFCGDNSGFSGELDCYNNNSPMNEMGFSSDAAASENAVWNIKSRSSNKRSMGVYQDSINETSFLQTGGYYKFGALNGYLQTGDAGPMTIEVGARDDVACSVTYRGRGTTSKGNTRYVNIVKVGTNVFTVVNDTSYVNNFGDITIKGGVLSLPGVPNYGSFVTFAGEGATLRPTSGELDFSARIKNSTSAIIIDDSLGGSATWNTALDSSNNGGLVKDGYGTLTLTKVPQYSGATVVKDGKLVVPFGTKFESLTLDGDASVEVDMTEAVPNAVAFSSGRFIGDASKVTLVNIPDGYTVQNIGSADNIIYGNGSTTYTWAGPTSTFVNEVETSDYAWETETNWTPNGVPGSLDVVVFGTAAPKFTLASDVAVMSVTVNGEGGFSYSADHALTVIGNFDVATAGTLEISGTGSLEVNGIVRGVTDVKMTPQPATSAIIAAHPYYTEKFRSGYDLSNGYNS